MLWQISTINQQIKQIDKQIAGIYFKFFPEAKTVISPRFRITQKLKEGQNVSDPRLFVLLNALVSAQQKIAVNLEQLRYQNKNLQATLTSSGFQNIEDFQNELATQGLKVKQIQATTKDNAVHSIVELTL